MRRIALLSLPLIVLGALVWLFATNIGRDPGYIPSVLINKPAPDFTLPPVAGLEHDGAPVPGFSTATLKGQVSVVNVFASWCIPCRDEAPLLVDLSRQGGFQILGINQKDQPANAAAFLARYGNPYAAIGADSDGRVSIDWGVYGVPETFIVDPRGIITHKIVGPLNAQNIEKDLLPAIVAAAVGN
ncbi:MAG TPA: DsbE family thiol:disulfide interchange protein [Devosiaceae bacterium]